MPAFARARPAHHLHPASAAFASRIRLAPELLRHGRPDAAAGSLGRCDRTRRPVLQPQPRPRTRRLQPPLSVSNILFVLYHDFSANSAVHVHNFANQLALLGHTTAVAIPKGEDTGRQLGEQRYAVRLFDDIDGDWSELFPNGCPPEIVHAWTPRENVRLFCEMLAGFCEFSLFVHLEDNEELILEANLGESFEDLLESDRAFPRNLS